jgi:hypothetical protein
MKFLLSNILIVLLHTITQHNQVQDNIKQQPKHSSTRSDIRDNIAKQTFRHFRAPIPDTT